MFDRQQIGCGMWDVGYAFFDSLTSHISHLTSHIGLPVTRYPLLVTALLIVACSGPPEIITKYLGGHKERYLIYVNKRAFKLWVYDGQGKVVTSYRIAIGSNPEGRRKIYQGDNATPEGIYHIVEILSVGYKKLKRMNSVYFKASDGHSRYGQPLRDLGIQAYGPRYFLLDYPNKADRVLYESLKEKRELPLRANGTPPRIGGGIGIHGTNDPASIGHKASSGCIRMLNEEIIKLDKYIHLGTTVIIEG